LSEAKISAFSLIYSDVKDIIAPIFGSTIANYIKSNTIAKLDSNIVLKRGYCYNNIAQLCGIKSLFASAIFDVDTSLT
jgi:hypothetical protein